MGARGQVVQQPRASPFHSRADTRYFVRLQVVHDHDVPQVQRLAEHLFDIDTKYLTLDGASIVITASTP